MRIFLIGHKQFLRKALLDPKRFKKIYIEITNICNLQCSFCPKVERPDESISQDNLQAYFKKIQPWAERVCLHVMGEPLNHPDFIRFIELANQYNMQIEITTNGVLLNQKTEAALLNKAVVQVNFSIQSFFDNFKNTSPDKYLLKIFNFTKNAMDQRPDLYINYRLWNINSTDASEVTEYVLAKINKHFNLCVNPKVDPGFKKSKNIINRLYLHFDTRFEWPNIHGPILSQKGRCYGTRSHLAVHTNGDVVPCCLDKEAVIKLGNLSEHSIEQILESPRYLKMRQGFEQGLLTEELCKKCDYIQRFN